MERLLTAKEVSKMTKLSRQSFWRLEKKGKFHISRKIGSRRVMWLQSEVSEWLKNLPKVKDLN